MIDINMKNKASVITLNISALIKQIDEKLSNLKE